MGSLKRSFYGCIKTSIVGGMARGVFKRKLIRTYYDVIRPFRRMYWYFVRPRRRGVKVLVRCGGRLLFVRNTYKPGWWTFPGGGVGKKETYGDAARRELYEEVGIDATDLTHIGQYTSDFEYKVSEVWVYLVEVENDAYEIDLQEIAEAQWIDPFELPTPYSPRTPEILLMLSAYDSGCATV